MHFGRVLIPNLLRLPPAQQAWTSARLGNLDQRAEPGLDPSLPIADLGHAGSDSSSKRRLCELGRRASGEDTGTDSSSGGGHGLSLSDLGRKRPQLSASAGGRLSKVSLGRQVFHALDGYSLSDVLVGFL